MDWHHPNYLPRRQWENDRPAEGANMDKYVTYMKNQLKELLTNYGKISVLWFDGEWENTWTHEKTSIENISVNINSVPQTKYATVIGLEIEGKPIINK